jgi:hypothetical protein
MKVVKCKFTRVSGNEIKLEFDNSRFLLIEDRRGVYSIGKAVQLYQLDGLKKEHIKELAWTRSDNHGGMISSTAHYKSDYTTLEGCQSIALDYLENILGVVFEEELS